MASEQLALPGLEVIPAGVRLDSDVPASECARCALDTEDHTIGGRFPAIERGQEYIQKVCVKDWRRHEHLRGPAWPCSEASPCCDRRDEYNGFASGSLLFECPRSCACHD